ncbi:MAG: hypothetical protein ACP5GH_02905 [Nitrososphaeria archaeon]
MKDGKMYTPQKETCVGIRKIKSYERIPKKTELYCSNTWAIWRAEI